MLGIVRAAEYPDIGGVVGADRRSDPAVPIDALVLQHLEVGDRGQHDIDDVLLDHRAHLLEKLGAGAEALMRSVRLAQRAAGLDRRPHVAVLGVGDDEIAHRILALADAGQFFVQSQHVFLLVDNLREPRPVRAAALLRS